MSCLVPVGFALGLSSCFSAHARTCCHEHLKAPLLVDNHWKVFLCLIIFCVINFMKGYQF